MTLAEDLTHAAQVFRDSNPKLYLEIESEYGGPGALNDMDQLKEWVEENPEQAQDYLTDLEVEYQKIKNSIV